MTTIAEELEAIEERRERALEALGERVRREHVLPFCKRYRLEFVAGNGTYIIFGKGPREGIEIRDQEDAVRLRRTRGAEEMFEALDLEIDQHNWLGTAYVPDVREADYAPAKTVSR